MRKKIPLIFIAIGTILAASGLVAAMEHQGEHEDMQQNHMATHCMMMDENSMICMSANDGEMHEMMMNHQQHMMEHMHDNMENHREMHEHGSE